MGLLFSAIGAACLAASSFAQDKNKMLTWQIADYIFTIIANILLGGYTGAVTIFVSIFRNILMIKKWDRGGVISLLILLQIGIGLSVNNLGWIGLLPIISSLSYSLASHLSNKVQFLRWIIIENMLLWLLYDLTIGAYPAAVMDIFITLTTLAAISKYHKKE